MNKRGMVWSQVVGLIIGVAVVVLLLYLLFLLFVPMFNKGDETAKSYFENLKKEIEIANEGGTGEFFMWSMEGYSGEVVDYKQFFLVYFGEAMSVDYGAMGDVIADMTASHNPGSEVDRERVSIPFSRMGSNSNTICVCYVIKKESFCNYCENLDSPAVSSSLGKSTWYLKGGSNIEIKLEGGKYVFSKK
jgi:hypothetical protein